MYPFLLLILVRRQKKPTSPRQFSKSMKEVYHTYDPEKTFLYSILNEQKVQDPAAATLRLYKESSWSSSQDIQSETRAECTVAR